MAHHGTLEAQRRYADAHRDYYRRYNVHWRNTHRTYFRVSRKRCALEKRAVIDALKNKPCADCYGWFASCVMQFDHIDPTTKLFNVGNAESKSIERIVKEAKKCDVVCANCHALRTQSRRPRRMVL